MESYIEKNSSKEGMNWFKYNLHKLRQEYLRYIGKPQDIAECIKIYNKLKETQYLDIATSRIYLKWLGKSLIKTLENG